MMVMKDGTGGEFRLFDLPPVEKASGPEADATDVQAVFDHWVTVHRTPRRGPTPVLTAKRRTKITRAIADYGVDTCLHAISGCAMSDWHMGDNPNRKKYDDLELILRDAPHIERFATIYLEGGDDEARRAFLDGDDT
jgi:hypothetical protein